MYECNALSYVITSYIIEFVFVVVSGTNFMFQMWFLCNTVVVQQQKLTSSSSSSTKLSIQFMDNKFFIPSYFICLVH